MADGKTVNYNWWLPEDHINSNLWGGYNNSNWSDADTKVYANQQAVAAIRGQTSTTTVSTLAVARTASVQASVYFNNSLAPAGQQFRWQLLETVTAEATGNIGSDFALNSYDNVGAYLRTNIFIARSTGLMTFTGAAVFSGAATIGGSLNVGAGNLFVTSSGASLVSGLNMGPQLTLKASAGTPNPLIQLLTQAGSAISNWQYNATSNAVSLTFGLSYLLLDNAGNFNISGGVAYKPGGGSWTATSDERIKNILDDYAAGLDEVLQLRPVEYTFKGNDALAEGEPSRHAQLAEDGTVLVGLVAQEVEAIFPGMVSRREGWIDGEKVTDLRDINTSELVFALVNCVKELKAEIEALKAK